MWQNKGHVPVLEIALERASQLESKKIPLECQQTSSSTKRCFILNAHEHAQTTEVELYQDYAVQNSYMQL